MEAGSLERGVEVRGRLALRADRGLDSESFKGQGEGIARGCFSGSWTTEGMVLFLPQGRVTGKKRYMRVNQEGKQP